ncbi:MAG: WhiB family transcriptional regulator [Nocardiopsaceae bacterium]|jgi:WhiB family redox-sensing transcriptional regulator|nr:WhiB family transcriptional regulator [Nocardiopsaceae bacterium]
MTEDAHPGDWWARAACRSADPDLFFPVSSAGLSRIQVAAAKELCARCQVRAECLQHALQAREVHGVWGGTSEEERRYLTRSAGSSSRVSFRGLRTR